MKAMAGGQASDLDLDASVDLGRRGTPAASAPSAGASSPPISSKYSLQADSRSASSAAET